MFDAAKLDTFFNVHNTFFVFNGTFIEEPFSYTFYFAFSFLLCCDNPSKWGLQQLTYEHTGYVKVVITPQNGVFNNKGELRENKKEVVITPQNGVFNNT